MSGPNDPAGGTAAAAQDPKRVLEQAFEMGVEFPGPAEDLLLSWVLSLPVDADAPGIAAVLAAHYRPGVEAIAGINAKHPIYRLLTLLEQTSAASSARLGRRGGRRRT
jgi:hypothetical protein